MLWPTREPRRLELLMHLFPYPPRERWASDVMAYTGAPRRLELLMRLFHTHLVRGGPVMLWPTREPRDASSC